MYMVEILVTEWAGRNLIEDVDMQVEKKNTISGRPHGRLCRKVGLRLQKRLHMKLCIRLREKKKISTWEPQWLDLVIPGVLLNIVESLGTCKGPGTKGSVKASRSFGANGRSVSK
ncbi:hypothetical protein Tco_0235665 [Tanacetum coccineum]